jgi:CDP-diacylglycerol--glycerol-3-phosphate 3-phosphatidyltransferase
MLISIRYKEWYSFAMLWMYGVVFFALVSAIQYFAKFWTHIDGQTKLRRRRELIKLERHDTLENRRQRRQNRTKAPDNPSGPHRPTSPVR